MNIKDKEEIRKAFFEKAKENQENFRLHQKLIEDNLCKFYDKTYIEDLKVFADRQVVDNMLLLQLIEYAEAYNAQSIIQQEQKEDLIPVEAEAEIEKKKWQLDESDLYVISVGTVRTPLSNLTAKHQREREEEAVRFVRWINECDIYLTEADGWEYDNKLYDDKQLYSQFKKEIEKGRE